MSLVFFAFLIRAFSERDGDPEMGTESWVMRRLVFIAFLELCDQGRGREKEKFPFFLEKRKRVK